VKKNLEDTYSETKPNRRGEKPDIAEKMKLKEKLSFGVLNLGGYMALINAFLMIYYTDVIGLKPAAVATLFLVTRVADGLNDPIMGYIIDHLPRTKMGRFRGYLLIGTFVCSINYVLLWFGPAWVPAGKLAVAYVTYILIGITFDMMDIPGGSLLPAITDNQNDRAMLSTFKGVFSMISQLIYGVLPPMILQMMGDEKRMAGYYILIFGSVAIALISVTVGTLGIRERVTPIDDEKYKFKEIYSIITQRPIFSSMMVMLLFGISASASGSSSMYFFTYMMDGRVEILGTSSIFSIIGVVPAVLFSGLLVKRFSKKRLLMGGLTINMLCFALRLIDVTNVPLIYITSMLGGFPLGLLMVLVFNIQADNTDYVEYKTGRRAEAGISSAYSFVVKSSHGVGGAIAGYVLSITGYVANQPQTDLAKFGIVFNILILPMILYTISEFVFGFGYNLTPEKLEEVNAALRQRREEKESGSGALD